MDADEFRKQGKEMIDFIADYLTNVQTHRVVPNVKPNYMRSLIDEEAPEQGEPWENIFKDIERVIMPGASSPACTELEVIMMDWLAKMIGLPDDFLHSNAQSAGGGVIQTTASEATLVALLAAREEAICRIQAKFSFLSPAEINGRLVAYCSDQAHSSVEKACFIGLVKLSIIPSDDKLRLYGDALVQAIAKDKDNGLIPFYVSVL
ncbi:unnamed protein product [Adineta steineri]|uniref:Histidine decarboxylase n=1 Tax=Adineta steineri TaxID=433720 RepID=A0A818NNQ0_9BILA|nr:unnamed protein product [Adineta steineri]